MNTYEPGNTVTVSVMFTTNAVPKVPVDPTTIVLRVTDPIGLETAYTYGVDSVIKNSTGSYSFLIDALLSGIWSYRWEGDGVVDAASESRFLVKQSSFANPQ